MSVLNKIVAIFLVLASFFSGSAKELVAMADHSNKKTSGNTDGKDSDGGASAW
jgi:hypothetical protein